MRLKSYFLRHSRILLNLYYYTKHSIYCSLLVVADSPADTGSMECAVVGSDSYTTALLWIELEFPSSSLYCPFVLYEVLNVLFEVSKVGIEHGVCGIFKYNGLIHSY